MAQNPVPAPISSITRGPRQTNMELLRITAMLLVLTVHADFWTFHQPGPGDFRVDPVPAVTRVVIESVAIICVNLFVLISGWFSIRSTVRGFCNFAFQCLFFLTGIYVFAVMMGWSQFSAAGLLGRLTLTDSGWFVLAYMGLYVLSPVLNAYVKSASRSQLEELLISFYAFQTIYGWCAPSAAFIMKGYSTFSFIGLYLLARYVRLYVPATNYKAWQCFAVAAATFLANSLWYIGSECLDMPLLADKALSDKTLFYTNPLVVAGAMAVVMGFSRLRVRQSRLVNWIAASSFAVFLLHIDPPMAQHVYKHVLYMLYRDLSGIPFLLSALGFMFVVFACAVLLDQPRIWIWRGLQRLWRKLMPNQ